MFSLVKINGNTYLFHNSINLADFLLFLNIDIYNRDLVLEYNRIIVKVEQNNQTKLKHKDIIEIVYIVGGG